MAVSSGSVPLGVGAAEVGKCSACAHSVLLFDEERLVGVKEALFIGCVLVGAESWRMRSVQREHAWIEC